MIETNAHPCPVAPPSRASLRIRVLHRACQKLGGVEQLARFLKVPSAAVYRWLGGDSEPPMDAFLKAVDIVMPAWTEEDEALSRELLARRPPPPDKKP